MSEEELRKKSIMSLISYLHGEVGDVPGPSGVLLILEEKVKQVKDRLSELDYYEGDDNEDKRITLEVGVEECLDILRENNA